MPISGFSGSFSAKYCHFSGFSGLIFTWFQGQGEQDFTEFFQLQWLTGGLKHTCSWGPLRFIPLTLIFPGTFKVEAYSSDIRNTCQTHGCSYCSEMLQNEWFLMIVGEYFHHGWRKFWVLLLWNALEWRISNDYLGILSPWLKKILSFTAPECSRMKNGFRCIA